MPDNRNAPKPQTNDWIIRSNPVAGDNRAFDVTVRTSDGNPAEFRLLTMRHVTDSQRVQRVLHSAEFIAKILKES